MAYSEQARRAATDTLQRRKNRALLRTDENRASLFAQMPALAQMQTDIAALGVELLRLSVTGDETAKAQTQTKLDRLADEQTALLTSHGYDADALAAKPVCADCGDTGMLPDGGQCGCVRALLRAYALAEISKISPLALSSFDSFSLDYYDTETDPDYGISPRKNAQHNLALCRAFAEHFPRRGENLLMLGDAGLGKTHLALSIAGEVLDRGFDVIYCSAANIFKQIETEHFDGGHDATTLDSLKRCELLVLDDLGAEFNGPFVTSTLYDLVNTRIGERRSTIYTTNFTDEAALMRRYGEKISSRLIGCCTLLPFFGEDIRIKKGAE